MNTPPTGSAITLHHPSSSLYVKNTCFERNQAFGPATVLVEDTTVTSRSGNGGTSLRVNLNNYFEDNRVAQSNRDSSFQWCHNSIYNFIEGSGTDLTFDDCVPGTATCCIECSEEEEEEGEELEQTGESSSSSRVVVSIATVITMASSFFL